MEIQPKGVKYFAYAVYDMDILVKRMFKEYRKCFDIESCHKLMNAARARTSSKNPVLVLLYAGLGFVLIISMFTYNGLTYTSEEEGVESQCRGRLKTC